VENICAHTEFRSDRDRKQANRMQVEERRGVKGEMRGVHNGRIGAMAFQISKE